MAVYKWHLAKITELNRKNKRVVKTGVVVSNLEYFVYIFLKNERKIKQYYFWMVDLGPKLLENLP